MPSLVRQLACLTFALAVLPACWAQVPDLEGFWTVQMNVDREHELLRHLPADAVFVDDAGGGELADGEYSGLQLSEQARQAVANYDFDEEFARENTCVPPSAAFYMQAPFPIEVHQGRDMIVLRMEYFDMVRVIFLDGREHPPAAAPHSKNGHSIGHWDGAELVVDTTHLASATFMNNGFDHSDDLHLVERFALSEDGNTLYLLQVSGDPAVFSGKAARFMAWRRVPGEYIYPYDCDPSFGR